MKPLALHHLKAAGGSACAAVWDAHKELGTLLAQAQLALQRLCDVKVLQR